MRFAEIALLLTPLLVFVAWRLLAPVGKPPVVLVLGVTAVAAAMVGLLLLLWFEEASPPNASYVPARQEDGHIVPPRVEPPAGQGR